MFKLKSIEKELFQIGYEAKIQFIPSDNPRADGKVVIIDTKGISAVFSEQMMEDWCRWFLFSRYEEDSEK